MCYRRKLRIKMVDYAHVIETFRLVPDLKSERQPEGFMQLLYCVAFHCIASSY